MAKYLGVKTADEANALNQEYIKGVNEHNKKLRTQRNMIMLGVACLAALAILLAHIWIGNGADSDSTTRSIIAPILIVMLGIDGFVFFCCNDEMKFECEWNKPFAYQFFKLTDSKTILKTDVSYRGENGNRDLLLTLKNADNVVSHERIYDFKTVTKTDIDDIVVDLEQGVIYLPYKDFSWR